MEGPSSYTQTPSLSESYRECIQSFRTFLLALSEDSSEIRLKQVNLAEILEEHGRTTIWGDQTKADLPARARGSLDDTLRHDDELKRLVQGILVRLRALLDQARSIARRKYDPARGSDHDSISSVSADSDSDSDDGSEHQRQRVPKIRLFVKQILGQIQSLYDLSSLLRRPKIADKYIRSINSKSDTARLSDSDTLSLSVSFSSSDERHIAEKVLQWRGLTKSGRSVEFEDEHVAPMRQGLTSDGVKDILWFCRRLARANTRRREQLQYWTDYPYDLEQDSTNAASVEKPDMAQSPKGPRSTMSKQSFSTAAVSDIHDTKTNIRPRTVYAPTAIGQARSNYVPKPPKLLNESATFSCPYCGMTLEYSEMQNRQSWKRHVFRDLGPYVCTFEDCQNAGKLYISRHDWIYHELQIHRREYACKECHKIYPNKKAMSTHLREHYGESISPARLGVVLDLCDRQVDVSDNKKYSCLVCGEELSLSRLQGHLAAHMEDIALFVLPNMDEEEETGGSKASKASIQVAKLKSKGETSDAEAEESSLGFSETGNHGQAPAELAKILNNEEIAQGGSYGNSLQAASYASDEKAVQALLDKGAKARSLNTEAFDFESGVDEDEVRDTDFDPLPATTFEDVTGGTDGQELQARGDGVVMENAGDEAIAAAYTVEKAEQEAKAKAKEEEEKKAAEDAAKLLAAAKKAREEVEEKTAEEAKAATEAHGKALAEVAAAAEEPAQPPGPMPPGPLPPPSLGGEPWTPLNMPRRESSKGKGRAGKILGDGPIRLPPPPPQIIDVGSPPSPMVEILSPMPPGPMPVPKPAKAKPKPHPNVGFLRWTAGGAVRPAGKRGKTSETPTSSGGDATSPGATTRDEDSQHSNNAKAS